MRVFIIETMGDDQNGKLVFIDGVPKGIGLYASCMAEGELIGNRYPSDARIYLEAKSPGRQLCSLLGNTNSYLITNTEMKDVILSYCKEGVEMLPFTLYDHKKKIYSKDYWIVNPIGTVNCVDRGASEIVYLDNSKKSIVKVKKFVLDSAKLIAAPALFRVPEDPTVYFVNERLVKTFQERKFSNVYLNEVEVMKEK